jgi:uncharacterized coiled-coil DUF342 family protein
MAVIKAGIPHLIKVNTNADKMGYEAGFRLHYFNDATGEAALVDESFFELTINVDDVSTTVSGDQSAGTTVIPVDSVDGFSIGSTIKIGGIYYRVGNVDTDNSKLTLKRGLEGAAADGDAVELSGRTGTYGCYVTFPEPGSYTIHITNFALGMDNEPAPIMVKAADVDDVENLLKDVKVEVDSIREQVDVLDEEKLNEVANQFTHLSTTIENIRDLINDITATVVVTGDQTSVEVGDIISGKDSGALGNVLSATYDSDSDETTIKLDNVKGNFDVDNNEVVHNDTQDVDLDTIKDVTYGGGAVDSVAEFVKQLNEELEDGSTGLDAITTLEKDIKHLINGDDELEDGSECPTKGKGLVKVFDELVATHDDVTAIKDLAEDATNGFKAIRDAVDDARNSIESKIAALVDEDDENSLASKINAVKDVVDANKDLLENDNYGLSKIMDAANNLLDLFADGGDIEVRFDDIDDALTSLSTKINDSMDHIDTRFDEVLDAVNGLRDQTTFRVFA